MVDPEYLLDHVVEKIKDNVDEYVVIVSDSNELMAKYARGESTVTQSWRSLNVSIYVAKDSKTFITSFEAESPVKVLDKLGDIIRMLQPNPFYAPLPQPTGQSSSSVDRVVKEVAISGEAERELEELELDTLGDFAGKVEFTYEKILLTSSTGADFKHEGTSFNGYMRVFRNDSSGQWAWTSTRYNSELARRACSQARELAETCHRLPRQRIEPGRYRVLLSPMVVGNLVDYFANAASASSVIFGMSFLHGKEPGSKLFNEKLTVVDRPRDQSLPGYRGFDDEGYMTRDKPIVEKGVFKGLLHNSKTAKVMKTENTGNAGWITPRPFNLEVAQGDTKLEEITRELRDGVYITNNWYTRYQNYLEGIFSTVSRDAVIIFKNGEPVACSEARIRIADSMPRLFLEIEAISRERWDLEWWEVRTPSRVPFILFRDVNITTPQ